jgi:hypothetical protein
LKREAENDGSDSRKLQTACQKVGAKTARAQNLNIPQATIENEPCLVQQRSKTHHFHQMRSIGLKGKSSFKNSTKSLSDIDMLIRGAQNLRSEPGNRLDSETCEYSCLCSRPKKHVNEKEAKQRFRATDARRTSKAC